MKDPPVLSRDDAAKLRSFVVQNLHLLHDARRLRQYDDDLIARFLEKHSGLKRGMRSVTSTKRKIRQSNLRDEALRMLNKQGSILNLARQVSRLMRAAHIPGVVIGGVAVVLHGHVRTTKDIDILVAPPLESLADLLTANGFVFDKMEKAFVKQGVPVHLVLPEQAGFAPHETVEIEGVTTVPLARLLEIKLRSGSTNLLRAQDLADAIGLIRHHQLTNAYACHLAKPFRPAFRKLVRLIQQEDSRPR